MSDKGFQFGDLVEFCTNGRDDDYEELYGTRAVILKVWEDNEVVRVYQEADGQFATVETDSLRLVSRPTQPAADDFRVPDWARELVTLVEVAEGAGMSWGATIGSDRRFNFSARSNDV